MTQAAPLSLLSKSPPRHRHRRASNNVVKGFTPSAWPTADGVQSWRCCWLWPHGTDSLFWLGKERGLCFSGLRIEALRLCSVQALVHPGNRCPDSEKAAFPGQNGSIGLRNEQNQGFEVTDR